MYLPDWEERFTEYLLEIDRKGMKFAWDPKITKALNCTTFINGGIIAVTGIDLYDKLARGLDYSDLRSAYKAVQTFGVNSLEDILSKYFEVRELAFLRTGDVVMVETEDLESGSSGFRLACGLYSQPFIYLMDPLGGLMKVSRDRAVLAFDTGSLR